MAPTHCDQGCGRTLKNSELGGVRNLSVPSFLLFGGSTKRGRAKLKTKTKLTKIKTFTTSYLQPPETS